MVLKLQRGSTQMIKGLQTHQTEAIEHEFRRLRRSGANKTDYDVIRLITDMVENGEYDIELHGGEVVVTPLEFDTDELV